MVGLSGASCARVLPRVNYTATGKADAYHDAQMDSVLQKRMRERVGDAANVTVLIDQMPRGMVLNGNTPIIDDNAGIEMVGKFEMEARTSNFFFIAKFIDYEEVWRKGLCYWQVPLEWLTLGAWSLSPTTWACFPAKPVMRKADALSYIKKAADGADADIVVMTYDGEVNETIRGARGWFLRTIKDRQLLNPLAPPTHQ